MPGEYITAIVQRELACLGQCSKFPDQQGFYHCPGQYEPKVEKKKGTLKTGSGKKVTSKKQAIAIGLSEARKAGGKVPRKKSSSKKK